MITDEVNKVMTGYEMDVKMKFLELEKRQDIKMKAEVRKLLVKKKRSST